MNVINATPLISLAPGRLSLLKEMFDEVIVPGLSMKKWFNKSSRIGSSLTNAWARRVGFAMGLPVKGNVGHPVGRCVGWVVWQEALNHWHRLVNLGIPIAPRWQQWFRVELGIE